MNTRFQRRVAQDIGKGFCGIRTFGHAHKNHVGADVVEDGFDRIHQRTVVTKARGLRDPPLQEDRLVERELVGVRIRRRAHKADNSRGRVFHQNRRFLAFLQPGAMVLGQKGHVSSLS